METARPGAPAVDPTTGRLIQLLPVAFLAHDLGELAGNAKLDRAFADLTQRSPVLANRLVPRFTTTGPQFAVGVGVLTAGCAALSWRAARSVPRSQAMTTYAAATLLLGLHMLGHVAHAVALRRYLPGLAGGLALSLPYSVLVVRRLHRAGLVDLRAVRRAVAIGAVLLPPGLLGLRALVRVVPWQPAGRLASTPSRTAGATSSAKRRRSPIASSPNNRSCP